MDNEFLGLLLKILVFLPFVLFLIYLSAKLGGTKLQAFQNKKYIKVIERVAISKDNSILVVEIGNKGYVLSSAQGRVEVLMDISDEEFKALKNSIGNLKDKDFNKILNMLKGKKDV